jgi:hypothetical protein
MKIDVPGCFAVGWSCALPQDWPSARSHLLDGLAVRWRSADSDVRPDARTSGRRLMDVIFSKDVQSNNPTQGMTLITVRQERSKSSQQSM